MRRWLLSPKPALMVLMGVALVVLSTRNVAQQDIASLLLRSFDPETRWTVSLSRGPGGEMSLATDAMAEQGGAATVTAGGGSILVEGVDPIVTGAIDQTAIVPDEERIDRSWKGDLPITITTPGTAPGFSAGALMEEHSRLAPPDPDKLPPVAFTASTLPLSALAVSRFISPKAPATEVADLQPIPVPVPRPDVTMLVAANYPARPIAPAQAQDTASAMVAAYAPDSAVVSQDMFAALFAMPKEKPDAPPGLVRKPGDHWWITNALPASVYTEAEKRCLSEAVYFEARSEPYDGQVAVAQVVLNRVRNPAYPDTICKVVYQNKGMKNACQFSFACDGIKDVVRSRAAWRTAQRVTEDVLYNGKWLDSVGTSTHYHATYVRPVWASIFRKKAKIGLHVFYQTIYGGWT